jgi:hypothetical protein
MQLLSTVTIVGLTIFIMVEDGNVSDFITLITAVVTLVILIWIVLATYLTPKAYNYWALLAMEILLFLAWIDGFIFALAAAFYGSDYYDYENCDYSYISHEYSCTVETTAQAAAVNASIAVAAFSACNMLLFLVSMIVVSVFIARHRGSGGHNKLGSAAPTSREKNGALMAVKELELRQQNLTLQQQYLSLQQQHFELQRSMDIAKPPTVAQVPSQGYYAPVAQYGKASDPEMGIIEGNSQQGLREAHPPVSSHTRKALVAEGSIEQQEQDEGKGKGRDGE